MAKRKSSSWVMGSADWLQYPEMELGQQGNIDRAYQQKAIDYLRQVDAKRSALMTQGQFFNFGYPGNRSDTAGYMKFQDYMRPVGTESGEAGKAQLAQDVMAKSEALKQDWQSTPEQIGKQQLQLARTAFPTGQHAPKVVDLLNYEQQEQLLYELKQYAPLLRKIKEQRGG
jgi:hypothetical protein